MARRSSMAYTEELSRWWAGLVALRGCVQSGKDELAQDIAVLAGESPPFVLMEVAVFSAFRSTGQLRRTFTSLRSQRPRTGRHGITGGCAMPNRRMQNRRLERASGTDQEHRQLVTPLSNLVGSSTLAGWRRRSAPGKHRSR